METAFILQQQNTPSHLQQPVASSVERLVDGDPVAPHRGEHDRLVLGLAQVVVHAHAEDGLAVVLLPVARTPEGEDDLSICLSRELTSAYF